MEAYTPVETDSDGYSDGVDFSAVLGSPSGGNGSLKWY